MKTTLLSILLCVFVCEIQAQTIRTQTARLAKAPATVNNLPIKRVILYSNGVAYIERRGRVTGHAEINLSFKHSQMDDVLKSLVVLDLGSGRIGAVSYNSSTPAAARMSEIPFARESYTLTNLTRHEVELFISRRYIDEQTRAALEHILELKNRLAATQARLQLFDKEVAEISQDQQRLRENIKALTQGTLTSLAESRQLIARYLAKANDQETRLEEIGKQRSAAIGERENLQREVDASIRSFQFERKIAQVDQQTPE